VFGKRMQRKIRFILQREEFDRRLEKITRYGSFIICTLPPELLGRLNRAGLDARSETFIPNLVGKY
jgi:hypothetical protein